jgi:hypothetical protein
LELNGGAIVGGDLAVDDVVVVAVHVALPEPVLLPDPLGHLLDGHVLGLRQEEEHEERHDEDPGGEEDEDGVLEVAEHGEEGLRDDEGEEQVDAHGDALPRRPRLQREGLAGDEPPEGAPGPGEGGDEGADHDHHHDGPPVAQVVGVVGDLDAQHHGDGHLRQEHLHAGLQQQHPPAHAVHRVDGHQRGQHVDGARDHRRVERRVVLESQRVEQHRRVEHDGVDPRELLEDLEEDGDDELGAVAALEEVAEGVLDLLRDAAGLHDLVELGLHIVGAADPLEHGLALLQAAALDEAVGGVRHEERAQGEQQGRDAGERQREPPSPRVDPAQTETHAVQCRHSAGMVAWCWDDVLGGAVVDEVGEEDADGDVELEQDVEPTADPRRRDLRQEQGNGLHGRNGSMMLSLGCRIPRVF